MKNKNKLLVISDHALTHSGVGIQSKFLIEGLIKTDKFKITQLGALKSHNNFKTEQLSKDFKIIPCIGFGDRNIVEMVVSNLQHV